MRLVRLLVAALVGGSLAIAIPAATAVAPPFNALTFSGSGADPMFAQDFFFDGTHGSLTPTVGTSAELLTFLGTTSGAGDSSHTLQFEINPNGGNLASTTYDLSTDNIIVSVAIDFEWACNVSAGTLSIGELTTDIGTGNITSFAADLTGASCTTNTPASASFAASIRMNSTQPYEAVNVAPRSWDFGDQITGLSGQAKTIRFANTGVDAVQFGAASVGATPRPFRIASNTCSGKTVQPGDACQIRVVPHPVSNGHVVRNLTLGVTGMRSRVVRLVQTGHRYASTYVDGGLESAVLTVAKLPAPADADVAHYRVDWGTHPTNLANHRNLVPNFSDGVTSKFTGLRGGTVYYFRIQPVFVGGAVGDATQLLAAKPWPKYSPGMYHRVSPFRLVNDHRVTAGHPFTLTANGRNGVPGGHVQAVALNVTASHPSASTAVRVYPAGSRAPAAADITVNRGAVRSNFVIAKVNSAGRFTISTAHGTTPITVDVSGYFSGTGLTTAGSGGALHVFTPGGTLIDTKRRQHQKLPGGYYLWSAMNFTPGYGQHVTAIVVSITAYGSTGSGSITAYAKDARIPHTSVLSYNPGVASSATAIVPASRWIGSDGNTYPAISFLNRGKKPVHLRVTSIGYIDDATFMFGQRYVPSAPLRLLGDRMGANAVRRMRPGQHANRWTTAMNLKVTAGAPTKTTALSLWPYGLRGITGPVQPQVSAPAGLTTTVSTVEVVGSDNSMLIRNAAGSTPVTVWSFGRFDAYPAPANDYLGASAAPAAATAFASVAPRSSPVPFTRAPGYIAR